MPTAFDQAASADDPDPSGRDQRECLRIQTVFGCKDASGKQRDINASTLELPMGSGPYKMKSFNPGSSITYERDPKWWAATEPTGIGTNNFAAGKVLGESMAKAIGGKGEVAIVTGELGAVDLNSRISGAKEAL